MNDAIVDDRRIRVDYSLTKRPHDRTPGYYAGKPTSELPDRRRRRSRSPPGRRYGGSGRDMSPRRDDRDRRRRSPSPYR